MNKLVAEPLALLIALTLHAQAAEPREERTASGRQRHLKEGPGATPKASDTVKVPYRGTLENGQEFDSSYKRGQPATFPLTRVIPCWAEGVQKIRGDGKARLVCPPDLACGNRDVPGISPGSTLIFEIELLDIARQAAAGNLRPNRDVAGFGCLICPFRGVDRNRCGETSAGLLTRRAAGLPSSTPVWAPPPAP